VIDRSRTRDIPEFPAATETAKMLGARVAETISGADIMSVQTGLMIASDPTTRLTLLASKGPSTYENWLIVLIRRQAGKEHGASAAGTATFGCSKQTRRPTRALSN
jgi:hypothetical protein